MAKRISVVVSQSPSKNPVKRKLEEDIVAALLFENGIDVTIVPNLYDIKPDSTGMVALKSIGGNMIVCSWLFERAAHWVLDRNEISGHVGKILLANDDDEDFEDDAESDLEDPGPDDAVDEKTRVVSTRDIPDRKIYCLDFKTSPRAEDYIEEIKRIHRENSVQVVGLGDVLGGLGKPNGTGPTQDNAVNPTTNPAGQPPASVPIAADRLESPTNDTALAMDGSGLEQATVNRIEGSDGRRWYPVIDYSRCTNCMECIDFCLFGVYGVDRIDTILVEQPDNCRKGCPACSRVCPENAIMFPQHKTPAIAGSADGSASMKIDLSQLFGAPAEGKTAEEIAAIERDEQLLLAGREAVGLQKRQPQTTTAAVKDELDALVDELDQLDL